MGARDRPPPCDRPAPPRVGARKAPRQRRRARGAPGVGRAHRQRGRPPRGGGQHPLGDDHAARRSVARDRARLLRRLHPHRDRGDPRRAGRDREGADAARVGEAPQPTAHAGDALDMTDHERWAESLGAWLLGALPDDEATAFRRHLEQCPICQEDAAGMRVAADAPPASAEPRTPPPALKQRIMAEVEAEAPAVRAPVRPPRKRRSWFAGGAWRPALAAGRAALVLGVVGAQVLRSGTDTITAQVSGGGSAQLRIDDGHGRLVASRLPDPPAGRVYQVWLDKGGKAPEPTDVLFTTSRDGSASADVPSLDGVKRVMVTDEPTGGSRSPTGKVLLTASV